MRRAKFCLYSVSTRALAFTISLSVAAGLGCAEPAKTCRTERTLLIQLVCDRSELTRQVTVEVQRLTSAGAPIPGALVNQPFLLDCRRESNNFEVRLGSLYAPGDIYEISIQRGPGDAEAHDEVLSARQTLAGACTTVLINLDAPTARDAGLDMSEQGADVSTSSPPSDPDGGSLDTFECGPGPSTCGFGCNETTGMCFPQCNPRATEPVCSVDRLAVEVCSPDGTWVRQACNKSGIGVVSACFAGVCETSCDTNSGYKSCADACYKECPSFRAIDDSFDFSGELVSGDGRTIVGFVYRDRPEDTVVWTSGSGVNQLSVDLEGSRPLDVTYDGSFIVGETFEWTLGGDLELSLTTNRVLRALSRDGVVRAGNLGRSGLGAGFWSVSGRDGDEIPGAMMHLVSGDGNYVVGSIESVSYRWSTTSSERLTIWTDGNAPIAISRDGSVIYAATVRWTPSRLEGIPVGFEAAACDAQGEIVVGTVDRGQTPSLMRWGQSPQPVRTVLENAGVSLDGWTLKTVTDISEDGSVIVGTATKGIRSEVPYRAVLPRI